MQYPIHDTYSAVYRDERGEERTTIHNDGHELRMVVRGVTFTGSSLDDFEPAEGTDPEALAPFTLNFIGSSTGKPYPQLCGCEIEYETLVPIIANGPVTQASLMIRLVLGKPGERGGLDQETLSLELRFGDQTFRSRGMSGWFEDEMLDLQKALPEDVSLKTCIACAFSDYSPYGHGLFGSLTCFRDNKEGYRTVQTKWDLFRIWDTHTESVQETFHCPEFERRKPDTGYRG